MPRLEIALLGPPEIKVGRKPVKTDRRKAIALLAYLAVTGKPHPRDQLAALLWPDYDPESAYAYLRRTLWELNQILGKGWIEADRENAALASVEDVWLDTARFTQLIHARQDAVHALTEAVNLYRRDFLAGFAVADTAPFEDWQIQQAEYFRREFAVALEKLVGAHAQAGTHDAALPYARRWLALDPLNEAAQRAIMRLLAGMGDRTGAIRQYETCAQNLKTELGIDPQPETTQLYQAILHGELTGKQPPSEIAPLARSGPGEIEQPALHLPLMPTPFIGRRLEVEQVKSLIENADLRLLTLTGPGGTGKTRLSIQAASEVGKEFPDGVFFAPLASLQSADALVPSIAKALDFSFYREEERPRQQLLNYLREKRLLLILDNFEHLVDGSDLVAETLANAPGVKLVVTSRVRLNVQGEQLYAVGGMRIPELAETSAWRDPEEQAKPFSAIQLFLERARLVQPDFRLSKQNASPVTEICQLVQGMPLGLELAAAWVELLSPKEIAAEISRSLDFLETDQAGVPDRQRSLRAVFESSWTLLNEDEKQAFLGLCVFKGSFSRQAAQQVSGASLRTLLRLANKSWLQQTDGGRFALHELMRHYGEQRLKSDGMAWRNAKNRHAEYFANFVAEQSLRMQGPEQLDGLKALIEEFDGNIKNAWDWLVSERRWNDLIEFMILGLFQYGTMRWQTDDLIHWFRAARRSLSSQFTPEERLAFAIFSTLEVYCEESAQIKDAEPIKRIELIWQMVNQYDLAQAMGFWYVILGYMARARNIVSDIDESLEANLNRLREGKSQWLLGVSLLFRANWMSEYVQDAASLLETAKLFGDIGVIWEQGLVAEQLAKNAFQQRLPLAEVTSYYDRARQFYQKLKGYTPHSGINLMGLADVYFQQGKHAEGFALFEQEQKELERMGQTRVLEFNKHWESLFAVRYSTYEKALRLRQQSLELIKKLGYQSDLAWRLFELADVYRIFGEPDKALPLYEQAHLLFEKMNMILGLGFDQRARGDLALLEGRYSDALLHYQKYEAYAIQDNHLWSMAQSHARIALARAYLGDIAQARLDMQAALAEIADFRQDDLTLQTLLAEPVCLLQEEKLGAAIEWVSFLQAHPGSWNETKQQAGRILKTASRNLPQELVQAAMERGKSLDLDSLVAKLTG
jgi:predicted ATPase/DNA-binding SARP family transcriptional activator